jgi:hypothetical protein
MEKIILSFGWKENSAVYSDAQTFDYKQISREQCKIKT